MGRPTRRTFTPQQKLEIVLQLLRGEKQLTALAREHGVDHSPRTGTCSWTLSTTSTPAAGTGHSRSPCAGLNATVPRAAAQAATRDPGRPNSTGPVEQILREVDRRIGDRVGSFTNGARMANLLDLIDPRPRRPSRRPPAGRPHPRTPLPRRRTPRKPAPPRPPERPLLPHRPTAHRHIQLNRVRTRVLPWPHCPDRATASRASVAPGERLGRRHPVGAVALASSVEEKLLDTGEERGAGTRASRLQMDRAEPPERPPLERPTPRGSSTGIRRTC